MEIKTEACTYNDNKQVVQIIPKKGIKRGGFLNAEIVYCDAKEIIIHTINDNLLHHINMNEISYIQKL